MLAVWVQPYSGVGPRGRQPNGPTASCFSQADAALLFFPARFATSPRRQEATTLAMVRSYERHEATAAFALIGSNAANALLDADGKTAFLPALEDVLVWDVKRGEQRLSLIHI